MPEQIDFPDDDEDEFCIYCGDMLDEFGLCPSCDDDYGYDEEDEDGDDEITYDDE